MEQVYECRPAQTWEAAAPVGSGEVGALVFGDPTRERIILNWEGAFLPVDGRVTLPDLSDALPEARESVKNGRGRQAAEHFVRLARERGLKPRDQMTEGLYPDPFVPVCELNVAQDAGEIIGYRRGLDCETGEAFADWKSGGDALHQRAFVSRKSHALVVRRATEAKNGMRLRAALCDVRALCEKDALYETKFLLPSERRALVDPEGGAATIDYLRPCVRGGAFRAQMRVVTDGLVRLDGDGLLIENAQECLMIVAVRDADAALPPDCPRDYAALLAEHLRVYQSEYHRAQIRLAGEAGETVGEMLSQAKARGMTANLFHAALDFGRAAALMSYGQWPPNAQGVWNGQMSRGMLADYVLNIELEMAAWQLLPLNLCDKYAALLHLIRTYREDWRENARKLYGCGGVLVSSRSTNHGLLHHFSAGYPHIFWTAGAAWLANMLYDWYRYTEGAEILREATDFMEESFAFYRDFLVADENGALCFRPSVSPENAPGNADSMAATNATMDIAAVWELCENLLDAYGRSGKPRERVSETLQNLARYRFNPSGSIAEWASEDCAEAPAHRHVSQLYPAYPSLEAWRSEMDGDARLAEGCRQSLRERVAHGFLDGVACGWSLCHALCAAARLHDAAMCQRILDVIAQGYLKGNLLSSLNRGAEIFQIDLNLGLPAAAAEMLVISDGDILDLLPALPARYAKGEARGLLCRGGMTVKSLSWDLTLGRVEVALVSKRARTVRLVCARFGCDAQLSLSADEEKQIKINARGEFND